MFVNFANDFDDCFVLTIRLAPVALCAFSWNGKSSPREVQQKLVIQAGSFEGGFQRGAAEAPPYNVELALVFDDVAAAFEHAVRTGATALKAPALKPWGQTVAYVRDPFGTLVELASPLG